MILERLGKELLFFDDVGWGHCFRQRDFLPGGCRRRGI